jgi:CRISPR system Cascade subunit CasA
LTGELAGREELSLAQDLVALRKRQFAAVERRAAAGEIARADLERVRNDMAAAEAMLTTSKASAIRARLDLAAAIRIAPAYLDTIKLESIATPDDIEPMLTDAKIAEAMTVRIDILKAVADYDRAESDYRTAVASQYPEVHIGPGYTWERGLSKLPVAISLTFPSWDLNAAAIKAAEATREDAGARLEAAVAAARAGVAAAANDYRAAHDALAISTKETLPIAERLAQQAENEFAAGRIDRADWAAAQAGLASARLDELAARRRLADAQGMLEDALRAPLSGPETLIGAAPFREGYKQ